jgi:hypothetical protein
LKAARINLRARRRLNDGLFLVCSLHNGARLVAASREPATTVRRCACV